MPNNWGNLLGGVLGNVNWGGLINNSNLGSNNPFLGNLMNSVNWNGLLSNVNWGSFLNNGNASNPFGGWNQYNPYYHPNYPPYNPYYNPYYNPNYSPYNPYYPPPNNNNNSNWGFWGNMAAQFLPQFLPQIIPRLFNF